MSRLAGRIVAVAAALSPAEQRGERRETWQADIRDATSLDLSPTRIALGALSTVILHPSPRREARLPIAAQPHTIRTIPVLVAVAFLSVLAGGALIALLGRYSGSPSLVTAKWMALGLLSAVPALALMGAALLVEGASRRARAIACVAFAVATFLFTAPLTGALRSTWICTALAAALALGTWLALRGRLRSSWLLIVAPAVATFAVELLVLATLTLPSTPVAVLTMAYWGLTLVPFAVVVACVRLAVGAPVGGPGREAGPSVSA